MTRKGSEISVYVAMIVIAIAGLNLNGLAFMLAGFKQAFSPLLLAGSVYLVLSCGRIAVRDPVLISFATFIFVYAGIGSLAGSWEHAPLPYVMTYYSSLLIVFGIAAFVSSRAEQYEVSALLRFSKWILLFASLSVIFSGKLYAIYMHQLSSLDRPSGFFGNANEAGIAAVAAFALVLSHPSRSLLVNIASVIIALAAVALSFSKSSLLIAGIIPLVLMLVRPSVPRILLIAVSIIGVWLCLELFIQPDDLQIGGSQKARLEQLLDILSGDINEETTTGRTLLWSIAIERIEHGLLFGHGLGSFHHMINSVTFNGVWMGAHNVYLMAWGEAGLFAFVALILSMVVFLFHALRPGAHVFPILYFTILQFDMMAAHNALGLRFHNVLFGLCIGLMMWERRSKQGGNKMTLS